MMMDVKRQNELLKRREAEREEKYRKLQKKKKKRRDSSSSSDMPLPLPKKKPIVVNPSKFVEVFDPFQFVPHYNTST